MRPRKALSFCLLLGACALAPQPIPPEQIAAVRSQAEPSARQMCATFGFTETTTPPLPFCLDNAIGEEFERRFGWPRLQASGLDILGAQRMVAISRCIASRVLPSNPEMPACILAGTRLVLREDAQRQEQIALQAAAVEAQRRAAFAAAMAATPRTTVCNRIGATVICN